MVEAQGAAGHKGLVGNVVGRGDQAADVDAGGVAEDDAVAVDQDNGAVGGEVTEDFRGIDAEDAVQGDGA